MTLRPRAKLEMTVCHFGVSSQWSVYDFICKLIIITIATSLSFDSFNHRFFGHNCILDQVPKNIYNNVDVMHTMNVCSVKYIQK